MPPAEARLIPDPDLIASTDVEDSPEELAARARAWWLTRDPRTLWPRVDPRMLQASGDAIGRTVSSLLAGRSTSLGSAAGVDAEVIGVAALLTGTGPLLGQWVERGSLDVSERLSSVLSRHLSHGRMRVKRISHGVAPALGALAKAAVVPMVIKGFHTAHRYFAEPGLRPISDVDLIIAPTEIRQAEAALQRVGFKASHIVNTPYKRDWYPPDDDRRLWSFQVFHARDRWKLELHDGANFGELPSVGLRLDVGPRASTRWCAGEIPVRAPAQPLTVALLAAHLSAELHQRCLLRVAELVLVVRRDQELRLFDWDAFEALLDESGADRFMYPALALVEQLAPGTVAPRILGRLRRASTRLARAVVQRLTPTSPILEDKPILGERLMWATNPRQATQLIASWVNPAPSGAWRDTLTVYHSRAVRLLAGRASWIGSRDAT
jgi:hypothetical protein